MRVLAHRLLNRKGVSLLEALIGSAVLAVGIGATSALISGQEKARAHTLVLEEVTDVKTLLRDFVECTATVGGAGADCQDTLDESTPYISLMDKAGNELVAAWPGTAAIGGHYLVRAKCKRLSPTQYEIPIEWARVASVVGGHPENSPFSEDPLTKNPFSFTPLFPTVPFICSTAGNHPEPPDDPEALCQATTPQTYSTSIHFPRTPPGTCSAGGRAHQLINFRPETKNLTLPPLSEICGVNIRIPNVSFEYDDEFLMTYDGTIIVSSYYPAPAGTVWAPVERRPGSEFTGLNPFTWSYINNLYYEWSSKPYCLDVNIRLPEDCPPEPPMPNTTGMTPQQRGVAMSAYMALQNARISCMGGRTMLPAECTMPLATGVTTNKRGRLGVQLNPWAARILVEKTLSNPTHELKMIGYGNGITTSIGDCYHSAFDLEFELKYLP